MEKFNPYEFIKSHIKKRPFDENRKEDGNFNYIHEVDTWTLIDRLKEEHESSLASQKQEIERLREVILYFKNLLDSEDIVRNIDNDSDMTLFLEQGRKIVKMVELINEALKGKE